MKERNANMPNGLIDSKSNVHEIQIQSIQIRNTRQTDKYSIKVDITAKHLYICVYRRKIQISMNKRWYIRILEFVYLRYTNLDTNLSE